MKPIACAAVVTSAIIAAAASFAAPASAHTGWAHPVFVQNDDTDGNTIVAYDRDSKGKLTKVGSYATGGLGGKLDGTIVDHLASQGSLTYDKRHGLLYAVNAGSDSITIFEVDGDRLHRRQVIGSGGTFPVSVTVHGDRVYVLNAKDGGSLQGFQISGGGHLTRVASWHRDLGLDTDSTITPGHVLFTPDGDALVVATRGNGDAVQLFGLDRHGVPAKEPVVYTEDGTAPFAVTFDRSGHLLVVDSGTNAVATFALSRSGKLTKISQTATGEKASCWIAGTGRYFYTANAGSNTLTGFKADGHGKLTKLGDTSTDDGPVDTAITPDGRFLYVQGGKDGVVDGFKIGHDGSLTKLGVVTVPNAVGGEGIVAL